MAALLLGMASSLRLDRGFAAAHNFVSVAVLVEGVLVNGQCRNIHS